MLSVVNMEYISYKEFMKSMVLWVDIVLIELRNAKENIIFHVVTTDVVVISNNSSIIDYGFFDNIPTFIHLAIGVFGVRIITNQ